MMEKDTFQKAKNIRENIDHLNTKKIQIERMKKRLDDEEFELARQLAHDGICYGIDRLEQDFKNL